MQSVFPTRLDTDRSVQSYRKNDSENKVGLGSWTFVSLLPAPTVLSLTECYHGRNKLVCTASCARGNELLK